MYFFQPELGYRFPLGNRLAAVLAVGLSVTLRNYDSYNFVQGLPVQTAGPRSKQTHSWYWEFLNIHADVRVRWKF
jgi:hypothetical protein